MLTPPPGSRLTLLTVLRVRSKYPMTVLKEEEPEKKKVSCLYVCSFKLLRYSCCSLVFLISAVWLQISAKLSSRQVFNLDRTVRHSRTFMSVPTGSKEHQEKTRWGNAELIKGRWRWRCSSAVINFSPSGPEGLASVPSTRQGGVDELL